MSNASEHPLVAELEELDRILVAFSAPVIDEHAGLRLMEQHLRDRRGDLHAKLAVAETPTLEIAVEGAAEVDGTLPVTFLLRLLQAISAAVAAHLPEGDRQGPAGGSDPVLRWVGGLEDATGVRLCGPSPPSARAATGTAGRSEDFTTAVTAVLDDLETGTDGGKAEAVSDLREVVAADWVRLRLHWSPPGADSREVVLDPAETSR